MPSSVGWCDARGGVLSVGGVEASDTDEVAVEGLPSKESFLEVDFFRSGTSGQVHYMRISGPNHRGFRETHISLSVCTPLAVRLLLVALQNYSLRKNYVHCASTSTHFNFLDAACQTPCLASRVFWTLSLGSRLLTQARRRNMCRLAVMNLWRGVVLLWRR